jgi:hypothetical protein
MRFSTDIPVADFVAPGLTLKARGSENTPFAATRWGAEVAAEVHGLRIGVRVNDPALLEALVTRLPIGSRPLSSSNVDALFSLVVPRSREGRRGEERYVVAGAGDDAVEARDLATALDLLASRVTLHVAETAADRVFLHAGVVGWQGHALVLPGRSTVGKTTLVRELMRLGASYYSDEFAVLDAGGLVHPFAKPLGIRDEGGRQEMHTAESLGGVTGTEPLLVGLVVLCKYRPGARWKPERLSPGQGLLQLVTHAIPARRKPAVVMDVLERVVERAPVLRGTRGAARRVAAQILSLMPAHVEE